MVATAAVLVDTGPLVNDAALTGSTQKRGGGSVSWGWVLALGDAVLMGTGHQNAIRWAGWRH